MRYVWRREWNLPAIVGGISFAAGVGVGYALKLLYDKYTYVEEPEQERESEDVVEQLKFAIDEATREVTGRFNRMIVKATDVLEEVTNRREKTIDEIAADVHASVAESATMDGENMRIYEDTIQWDWESELANRTAERPYVLHRDEFYNDEKEYGHISIMYYAGDNVLCDTDDVPIYDPDRVVGPLLFGHGSGDPDCFYVRNEMLESEFEVTRDPGSFFVIVLGGDAQVRIDSDGVAHRRTVPKFRE